MTNDLLTASGTLLASPAVLALEQVPGATQLLFIGSVVDLDGAPAGGAVVHVWDIRLQTEDDGRFELLAYGPKAGPATVPVTVTAFGNRRADALLTIAQATGTLADGTVVLERAFVLDGGDVR